MIKSQIYWKDITSQGLVNKYWVIETGKGTLVCNPAFNEDDSITFTAPNGIRYYDTLEQSQWTSK